MKFTIIMPTYNDGITITETLESIINQSYDNWELLISIDGSTDDTISVIERFIKKNKEKRIKYFYKENSDQLNAIKSVIDKISGDYVFVLHSDDVFADNDVLSHVKEAIEQDDSYDAYLPSGNDTMDESSNKNGNQKYMHYKNKEYMIPLQLLWLGRNLYCDVAFFKADIYKSKVLNNYLTWNTPFWLNYSEETSILKVKTLDYFFITYRVFEGNYINNEVGKLNVINGELRCASRILKYYSIPFYKLQYFIFRAFNKLGLVSLYHPLYIKKESNNKYNIIKFIVEKRYHNEYDKYVFLEAIVNFYKNCKNRKIVINKIDKDEFIYKGSDMRRFNKDMINNKLSGTYQYILKEMNKGFNEIEVSKKYYDQALDIIKFMSIYPHVKISLKESSNEK